MPFEDDRLRMQREGNGKYTVQLPGVWVGRGFSNEQEAMHRAEGILNGLKRSGTPTQRAQQEALKNEMEDLLVRQNVLAKQIVALEAAMEDGISDAQAVIDAGYDAIEAFEFDNRHTRKHGKPNLVFVTPWDKDRDGEVEFGEFEFCYGWGRYNIKGEGYL